MAYQIIISGFVPHGSQGEEFRMVLSSQQFDQLASAIGRHEQHGFRDGATNYEGVSIIEVADRGGAR